MLSMDEREHTGFLVLRIDEYGVRSMQGRFAWYRDCFVTCVKRVAVSRSAGGSGTGSGTSGECVAESSIQRPCPSWARTNPLRVRGWTPSDRYSIF